MPAEHAGFVVCGECEDGWVYPAPHGVDATDCPAFYDICRCEGTPCPSCRGSGLVGNSDTQRYRQLGNAVAVPVVEWILGNIVKAVPFVEAEVTVVIPR